MAWTCGRLETALIEAALHPSSTEELRSLGRGVRLDRRRRSSRGLLTPPTACRALTSTVFSRLWNVATSATSNPAKDGRGRCSWGREELERVWDVFAEHGMAFDRQSMYYDEGADSEFCEMHRRHLAAVLTEAGLVPDA